MADEKMHKVDNDQEARLADAAQTLMDIARSIVATKATPEDDADTLTTRALCVSVQALAMADHMSGPRGPGDFKKVTREKLLTMFFGMGMGIGHVVGACGDSPTAVISVMDAHAKGMSHGMVARLPDTMLSAMQLRKEGKL